MEVRTEEAHQPIATVTESHRIARESGAIECEAVQLGANELRLTIRRRRASGAGDTASAVFYFRNGDLDNAAAALSSLSEAVAVSRAAAALLEHREAQRAA